MGDVRAPPEPVAAPSVDVLPAVPPGKTAIKPVQRASRMPGPDRVPHVTPPAGPAVSALPVQDWEP
jgi:hypothetical protein